MYRVNVDPVIGSEIRKTRPAVIVSNDSCNRFSARVVVLPITSNIESLYPGEAMVKVKGKAGRALGDQIRSIHKSRLKAPVGRLTVEHMSESTKRWRSRSTCAACRRERIRRAARLWRAHVERRSPAAARARLSRRQMQRAL